MVTTQPLIAEFHTSELVAECPRFVQLKHQGKAIGEMTTALYRGQLAHAALEFVHVADAWDEAGQAAAMETAAIKVHEMARKEGRPFSASVNANLDEIRGEVSAMLNHYCERLHDYFAKCRLIGCELPVRWTMEVGPGVEPIHFASHVDLLFRDEHGQLCCWDWKHRADSPTMEYLGRSLQFGLYYLMLAYGEVRTDEELDWWETYGEFADFAWVHLPYFKPYTRRTEAKDERTGELKVFAKGDHRPLQNLVRRWTYSPDRENDLRAELALRVTAFRHGVFFANPSPIRCMCCEAEHACSAFHRDITLEDHR